MSYWWVFQGDSYRRASKGNYLWAPQVGSTGKPKEYWTNMTRVEPGDVIFSGCDQRLVAISTASGRAYDCPPPDPRDVILWPGGVGWRLDVSFVELDNSIPYQDFVSRILPLLPAKHAPFSHKTGHGNLGYLYSLPDEAGHALIQLLETETPAVIENAIQHEPGGDPKDTTRQALVQARRGQGLFRDKLDDYWSRRCAVSGITKRELLRGSHIKPWSSSNHRERLDPFNGLLLSVGYDAAFDALLLTFDEIGKVVLASDLDLTTAAALGIDPNARLGRLEPRHEHYLAHHRERFKNRH